MRFDIVTANVESFTGRIYPMSVVKKIAKKIETQPVWVILGAPEAGNVAFERVVGTVGNPEINEGTLSVEVGINDALPMAKVARAMLAAGASARLSGAGKLTGKKVSDYTLHCIFLTTEGLEEQYKPKDEDKE